MDNIDIIVVDEDDRFVYKEAISDGLLMRWAEDKQEDDPVMRYLAPLCDSLLRLEKKDG